MWPRATRSITALYPEIEPYDHGMLDVGDGNALYWEACGGPRGKPAVVLQAAWLWILDEVPAASSIPPRTASRYSNQTIVASTR
ncbi:MAG TPA: hypothetical protein VK926_04780 [Gaiellaceae bacterium]|nr:hypothetical protein [Gaiellaceae bacterium]